MKSRGLTLLVVLLLACWAAMPAGAQNTQTPANNPAPASAPSTDQNASTAPSNAPATPDQNAPAASAPAPDQNGNAPAASNTPAPAAGPDATAPVQAADPAKVKHDGGKDDVDAIGNRKVGGKGIGDWYSLETEIAMGKQYAQQIENSVKLVQDPVVTEYVNRIGQNLVRNSDAKVPFTIKVIDDDSINAFALPGGFFYVNSGLILAADNESEMAGVMAHEIAHVAARHATRQMTRAQLANFASIPLIFMGGGIGYAISSAAGLALPLTFLSFSRGFEAEADYLGLEYMYKTGYDPQSFVAFFEKVQAKEKKKPGTLAKAFSTHPQTPDRIAKSQEEINKILPSRPEYVVDTSEFQDVKARLASIENRRKLNDDKDKNRPTLRRTASDRKPTSSDGGDNSDSSSNKQDDDRPTLKRRDQ